MNEKRFKLKENLEDVLIEDTITQSQYSIYGIVDLLNEQQATIEAKDSLLSILAKENEQLRQELKDIKENPINYF